ncbi:nickel ABC transporter substrate-binding protein [Pseudochelatococcus sp. B33]
MRVPGSLAGMVFAGVLAAGWAHAGSTLTYSWTSNVGPLDPHAYSPNQLFAQAMLYEPLVKYGADGTILPWLAVAWTVSGDGRTYTFTLRDGVTFSDGAAFDAGAVKANFDTVLANRGRHDWLELANQVQNTEALDARTFRLTLKNPYYPILQELALIRPFRFISPAAIPPQGSADGIVAPVGTGPWKLAETRLGEYDVFIRNEAYWGPKPAYDRIVVKVIPDPNARAVAFETGDIDLIYGLGQVSPDTFARLQAMHPDKAALSQPLITEALALNSKRLPTSERAVRKAINHAVDKDAIVSGVLYGTQKRADTLFAVNLPYTDVGLVPYDHDPARAAALLDEAGWTLAPGARIRARDGVPLRIELCFVGNNAQQKAISEVIQADLLKVGIDVVLIGEEANSFHTRQREGEFGMIFGETWGAPYDPHSFVSSMRVPSHADYQAQLGLPMKADLDARIGEVLVTVDETARRQLYRDILTTLHDEAVYLPLTYATAALVAGPGVAEAGFGPTVNEIPFETYRPAD